MPSAQSFPRHSARTQGFTLGAPRNVTVSPDGAAVLFLRSSSGTDRSNALWALDFGFSMPSMIGVMMLLGVVTKNSILLVDYAVLAQQRGLPRHDAVLEACSKRARPIVMTTVAMVFGMLPLALGFGGDSSFRAPMAVVVMGGLLSSTLLSLLVVPVVYILVDAFRLRMQRLLRRQPLREQPA